MAPRPTVILDTLQETISAIFDQVQVSVANHRKNCVAVHKLHLQAGAVTQSVKNGSSVKLVGERAFGDIFIDMINRVLVVKKGPATADRIVKFIGAYVKFMNEKVSEQNAKRPPVPSSSASARISDDDDTIASRFVARLLKWLLPGFTAKNKTVRYRSVHIVSEMISHLGEIDEDMYEILRGSLIERVRDKESFIRAHTVVALSKLVGSEDPSELQKGEASILEVLLDVLCFDPAAEVRRAALLHIPLIPDTLDTILTRTRDTDPLTRKLVYSSILQAKLGHPRQLTISQREQVVKDGLGDREPVVRVAAGKMVAGWFDSILAEVEGPAEGETWIGDDGGIMRGLVGFLRIFDVFGSGEVIAVDAVLSIFVTRPALLDVFIFPEAFWKELSPESALLARVFVEHCLSTQNDARLEAASLPVVTAFAFHVQEAYNELLAILQEEEEARLLSAGEGDEDEESERREEDLAKGEVILGELLRVAVKLDYADEIGRRKVFAVVRDMLAHPQLPIGLVERCLDVLKEITPTERELIRVVVEVVIELRDEDDSFDMKEAADTTTDDGQSDTTQTTFRKDRESSLRRTKERSQMTPEEDLQADLTDMRCLTICIAMLERVHGSFEDNSTLEGILTDLIIPAVKRKELSMREKGLIALGLCCLIAKNMALSSFQLFLSQIQSAPDDLKVKVIQIVFDLLIMYDHEFFGRSEDIAERIITFLLQTLETEESDIVQTVLCIGISKLLLSGLVTDPRVLTGLVIMYVSPVTAENPELRQCLSYFFPVYCYSSSVNQSLMQSIFIPAYDLVTRIREEMDEDQEMVSPYQFGLLLVDWTNPQKAANTAQSRVPPRDIHVDLAVDILAALYDSERHGESQKILCQLLGHLYIMPGLEARSLLKLNILLSHLEEQCPFDNPASDKLMNRFKNRFLKLFSKELEQIDPREYVDEEFCELYNFIGIDIPLKKSDGKKGKTPIDRQPDQDTPSQWKRSPVLDDLKNETESASEDEVSLSSPTPTPKRIQANKRNPNLKSHSPPQSQIKRSPSIADDLDTPNTPSPSPTTPKKKGIKRFRSPASKAALVSPFNKKRNRLESPQKSKKSNARSFASGTESEGTATPTQITPQRSDLRNDPNLSITDDIEELEEGTLESGNSEEEVDQTTVDSPQRKPTSDISSDDLFGYSDV